MNAQKNKLTIVLLGRSGCGKGTQAYLLVRYLKKFGVAHLETGKFLRETLPKYDNVTTQRARRVMKKGNLFPYWFSAYTWLKKIVENGVAKDHWVFDGGPRRLKEAFFIDDVTKWHGRPDALCIHITLDSKEATKRLLGRGRSDDTASSIKNRMKFFQTDVFPVIRFYRARKHLITVDGSHSAEMVFAEVIKKLKKKFGRKWPQ